MDLRPTQCRLGFSVLITVVVTASLFFSWERADVESARARGFTHYADHQVLLPDAHAAECRVGHSHDNHHHARNQDKDHKRTMNRVSTLNARIPPHPFKGVTLNTATSSITRTTVGCKCIQKLAREFKN